MILILWVTKLGKMLKLSINESLNPPYKMNLQLNIYTACCRAGPSKNYRKWSRLLISFFLISCLNSVIILKSFCCKQDLPDSIKEKYPSCLWESSKSQKLTRETNQSWPKFSKLVQSALHRINIRHLW